MLADGIGKWHDKHKLTKDANLIGTAGLLACAAAGQYPRTRPSLSLALRHGLRLLPPSEEVPVCFGRP